jgi:hypothetical protein
VTATDESVMKRAAVLEVFAAVVEAMKSRVANTVVIHCDQRIVGHHSYHEIAIAADRVHHYCGRDRVLTTNLRVDSLTNSLLTMTSISFKNSI